MPQSYESALRYLWGLKRLGTRPGLSVTKSLLAELGDPQRSFSAIHITGSKGKGSTAAMCESILRASGLSTGLYVSPHLLSYRERISANGSPVTKSEVAALVEDVRRASEKLLSEGEIDREPTFFEVTTVAAFLHFKRSGVRVASVEVGLGGRLDSTNTIDADVCVVTTLEYEHTELLGPTLTDVAREKSGILHKGAVAVTGVGGGEGLKELERNASALGVPLWRLGREVKAERESFDYESQTITVTTPLRKHQSLLLPLLGQFQVANAAVALAAIDLWSRKTGTEIYETSIAEGLRTLRWPGRMQRLSTSPPFYADAAHTTESARELAHAVRELEPHRLRSESTLIFSCLKEKHANEMLDVLSEVADTAILTTVHGDRAMPMKEMMTQARGRFPRILSVPETGDALSLAREATGRNGLLVATGSLYLVSEVLAATEGIRVEEPDLSDPVLSQHAGGAAAGRRSRA